MPHNEPLILPAQDSATANQMETVRSYIANNHMIKTVEDAINTVAKQRPFDCFGLMADLLVASHGNPPVVERVHITDALDSQGNPAMSVAFYGSTRGKKKVSRRGGPRERVAQ